MQTKTQKITKDMAIAEILEIVPDAVDMMMDSGLHCVGCGANTFETLEMGMLSHGFDPVDVDKMTQDLNDFLNKQDANAMKKAKEEDFEVKEINEGNKKYYKLAGLMFSERAYKALHDLKGDNMGLQIKIEAGGCSGYKNKYDFVMGPDLDEKIFKLSDSLEIYMNDFTFDKFFSSIVDYESGLHGSGLKFINPNVKGSCSCGTSVAF